jgi:hypothetical protein
MNNTNIAKRAETLKLRLSKNYIWPLLSPLYVDYRPDYRRSIFLAGTERSGTTWMSDVINYRNEYRYIFEPFWPDKVSVCHRFLEQQYLQPTDDTPYFLKAASTILSGRVRNKWTDKYHRRFLADKRVIKDVRANLILKWIHDHFPEMPIIFMIRHPGAVVTSQLRRKHWNPDLTEEFLSQETLVTDFLSPFREAIAGAEDRFDKLVFRWCIQNYVPLKQFQPGEIHLIFYENFCIEPEAEVDRLFAFLGRSYDESIFPSLRKPSPVVRSQSAVVSGGSLIDNWRKYCQDDQIERAVEILKLFGLDRIYDHESMPKIEAAQAFMPRSFAGNNVENFGVG